MMVVRFIIPAVENTIIVTYSVYVFLALGIQREKRMGHIVICGLSGSTWFSHIL